MMSATNDSDNYSTAPALPADPADFLARCERDALRIHAQQIMASLVSEQTITEATRVWLLAELKSAAEKLAHDYEENEDRAYKKKEYDRWLRIAAISDQQLQALAGHHMGSATATGLLGDMSNLGYVLGMSVVNVLNQLPSHISSLQAMITHTPSVVSTLAAGTQAGQPYVAMGLFAFLAIFELGCIIKHYVKTERMGKEENARAKLLEGGRWLRLVNCGIWIGASITAVLLGLTLTTAAVPTLALMATTVFVTGMARCIHQVVQLTKLTTVLADYEKQLSDESTPAEKRDALQHLVVQLRAKIQVERKKLMTGIALTLSSVAGIVVTALAVTLSCSPLFFVGAAMLLVAGIVTMVLNRQAIKGAFHAIGKKIKKSKPVVEEQAKPAKPDTLSPTMQRFVDSVADMDEAMQTLSGAKENPQRQALDQALNQLADEPEPRERSQSVPADLAVLRAQQQTNQQTRRSLSGLARTHRPPTGKAADVIAACQEKAQADKAADKVLEEASLKES
jgi:Ca2+/Na+ antiporter